MTTRKRTLTIVTLVLATPLLCYGIALLYEALETPPDILLTELDPVAVNRSIITAIGILGSTVALITGPLISAWSKRRRQADSLTGYIVPCGSAILLAIVALLNVL